MPNKKLVALLAVLACVMGGELASRLDDRIRLELAFLATPQHGDLTLRDTLGVRGSPNARFKKWALNSGGFRGPEIQESPSPGCVRVAVLGASETLGYAERDGGEYPAQLGRLLHPHGCFEVINAGIVGMAVPGMYRLWVHWVYRYRPDIVVVYASPGFYLAEKPPQLTATLPPRGPESPEPAPSRSRLIQRLTDRVTVPERLQERRVRESIALATRDKSPSWFFTEPPGDRLDLFHSHLDSLIGSIVSLGAQPIMVTHAMMFSDTTGQPNPRLLLSWRQLHPRATGATLVRFEIAAEALTKEIAARRQVPLVDAAQAMTGCPGLFADAVHLTDEGALVLARLLAPQVARLPVGRAKWPGKHISVPMPRNCYGTPDI